MGDLLTYQSDNMSIVELLEQGIHFSHHLLSDFNIQQGERFPVIAQSDSPTVCVINWSIENPIISNGPKLSYVYGPSIEKQQSLKKLLRHQRVLIPVSKYIHRRSIDVPNVAIQHPKNKMLWMGGIWYENENKEKGFALITQNSMEEKRNEIRRIPIFITEPSIMRNWIDPDHTNLKDLIPLLSLRSESNIIHESNSMAKV